LLLRFADCRDNLIFFSRGKKVFFGKERNFQNRI
jgi:hypothetical protein